MFTHEHSSSQFGEQEEEVAVTVRVIKGVKNIRTENVTSVGQSMLQRKPGQQSEKMQRYQRE